MFSLSVKIILLLMQRLLKINFDVNPSYWPELAGHTKTSALLRKKEGEGQGNRVYIRLINIRGVDPSR